MPRQPACHVNSTPRISVLLEEKDSLNDKSGEATSFLGQHMASLVPQLLNNCTVVIEAAVNALRLPLARAFLFLSLASAAMASSIF